MQEGYLQAYVDFFYITTESTPSEIEPSAKLQEEYKLNKRKKGKFITKNDENEEKKLLALS
jgi:ABC-type tungstate transport system permease subunit